MDDKSNCWNCAYGGNIPGDAHIRCKFDFVKAKKDMPRGNPHGIWSGWYMFPMNYDPVWMAEQCVAFSETVDSALVIEKYNLLLEMLSMLR